MLHKDILKKFDQLCPNLKYGRWWKKGPHAVRLRDSKSEPGYFSSPTSMRLIGRSKQGVCSKSQKMASRTCIMEEVDAIGLFWDRDHNVFINEDGFIIWSIFEIITPGDLLLFRQNCDYMCVNHPNPARSHCRAILPRLINAR